MTPNGDSSSSRSMDSSEWSSSPPSATPGGHHLHHQHPHHPNNTTVPQLLLEIMNVEHLWHCNEQDSAAQQQQQQHRSNGPRAHNGDGGNICSNGTAAEGGDSVSSLCSIADHRLYKIVKWCKSLPLFKNIQVRTAFRHPSYFPGFNRTHLKFFFLCVEQIDDQISLLINTWCELLLFACCFRSMATPGEIRISHGKSITLEQARTLGLGSCIERMIHFTDHLRRLRVDQFEYAAMKVIILLSSGKFLPSTEQ